jgi:hypothetical protein
VRRSMSLRNTGWKSVPGLISLIVTGACGNQSGLGGDDQDGITGGDVTFEVTVTDDAFKPPILKTQNLANVTLTLANGGTIPHGFSIRCLGNKCFPGAAKIPPLDPSVTQTVKFRVPYAEGLFDFDANTSGKGPTGQFYVQ